MPVAQRSRRCPNAPALCALTLILHIPMMPTNHRPLVNCGALDPHDERGDLTDSLQVRDLEEATATVDNLLLLTA